jgi:cell division FtsZ-interacting protein ZapD
MLKHITAVALLGLTLAAPAAGQTPQKPDHAKQKAMMQHRIRAGVKSGQISPDELAAIRQHLRSFREQLRSARSSGQLTKEQRLTFKREWKQISRQVFRARHKG